MRSVFLTIGLALALMSFGCSGSSAPNMPDNNSAELPSWNFSVDGDLYYVDMDELLDGRQLASAVEPGTDMTAAELRVYFGVIITTEYFPQYLWHVVYNYYVMPVLLAEPDEEVFRWVEVFEINGVDVPNGPPPPPL